MESVIFNISNSFLEFYGFPFWSNVYSFKKFTTKIYGKIHVIAIDFIHSQSI